ncbi:MAG: shikimate kinase [Mucilaginibacter sp.]|nr:shikimate kinase [Mucilaginibacter sp.]
MSLLFLIGFMGCGKTTLGKKLASSLGYNFIDLDHVLEAQIGMTIPEYFSTHSEEEFRKLESEILKTTQYPQNTIVSTGGGLPCFFDHIEWMNNHGQTVYIQLSPKALASRLDHPKASRPVLQGKKGDELIAFIEHKLAEREGYYLQATHTVNGIDLSAEKVAEVTGLKD